MTSSTGARFILIPSLRSSDPTVLVSFWTSLGLFFWPYHCSEGKTLIPDVILFTSPPSWSMEMNKGTDECRWIGALSDLTWDVELTLLPKMVTPPGWIVLSSEAREGFQLVPLKLTISIWPTFSCRLMCLIIPDMERAAGAFPPVARCARAGSPTDSEPAATTPVRAAPKMKADMDFVDRSNAPGVDSRHSKDSM